MNVSRLGKMMDSTSNVLRGLNRMTKELGAGMSTWMRPAFWGLAATSAAIMLMGRPKAQPMTPPPAPAHGDTHGQIPVSGGIMRGLPMSGHSDLRPEMLQIPQQVSGRPTGPGMPSPSTYMTNSAPLGRRIMARGTSDNAPDYDSVTQAMRPIAGRSDMRVTYNDNRSRLTSQNISDMLEGV
jgi:hypothetical protein